jgi:Tfp pilus assembly protein PilF
MKRRFHATILFVVATALGSLGCTDKINYLKARYELNKGVEYFQGANYQLAAQQFEEAIALDPQLTDAKSYRAYSYMMQFIPGSETEENIKVARVALEGFQEVLDKDPKNELAMSSIASLHFNMKDFDKAREWYLKLIEQYPQNQQAYYTLGVISWSKSYEPRLEARAEMGMRQEDPGPIKDKKVRDELGAKMIPVLEEGQKMLEKALEVNPNYEDAMAYMNLLYRERADYSESKEEYDKFVAMADEWVQKTLDTRQRVMEESTRESFQ